MNHRCKNEFERMASERQLVALLDCHNIFSLNIKLLKHCLCLSRANKSKVLIHF